MSQVPGLVCEGHAACVSVAEYVAGCNCLRTCMGGMDVERHGIAIVVDDGVLQVQQRARKVERPALHVARRSAEGQAAATSHGDRGIMGASVVSSTSALDFFWRIFSKVAGYVTRVRRLFFFTVARKDGNLEATEERQTPDVSETKVERGLVEACRACEPDLAEIIVTSPEETTNHGIENDVDTKVVEVCHEDCAAPECTMESTDMEEEHAAPLACTGEDASATEQSTSYYPCQQDQVPLSMISCEPLSGSLPELHGEDCTANEPHKCHTLEQANSQAQEPVNVHGLCEGDEEEKLCLSSPDRDEQLVDAAINNKSHDVLQSLSHQLRADNVSNTENSLKGSSSGVQALDLMTSSPALKKRLISIKELNAVVAEQLTQWLHALERAMVPGKVEHRRAVLLATLVAIVVWARNAKHLHESMPRIRGSAINVHIRSRL